MTRAPLRDLVPTSTHWGNYRVETAGGRIVAVHPYAVDAHPTPIGQSLVDAQHPGVRVPQPMMRAGWRASRGRGGGTGRGSEPFVPVSWDEALDAAAEALERVRREHGNEAIFGGSYGWASAGRFHHANGQLHRFLNAIGGYTYSVNNYSFAAADVVMRHVLGMPFWELIFEAPTIEDMVEHTELVVCFGGIPLKNTQVMSGGIGAHTAPTQLRRLAEAGLDFVNVGPLRDDMDDALGARWWPCRPNTDVAIMLGLAHTLVSEGLHDRAFIGRYCTGFERFEAYLTGAADGQPKDADWAATISEIPARDIRVLARRMAAERTVIGLSWSLQRAEFGEQTYWMGTALAALLGSHGLPGAGVAYGYGSVHSIGFLGRCKPSFAVGALPQGGNPVQRFIPVARIADMLLEPGGSVDYDGQRLVYPDIRLLYWAGGNPFHHHQDLNRLRRAWARPETVIVNEPFWTATARHADIVFPTTVPLERDDFAAGAHQTHLTPMRRAVEPFGQARDDHAVFAALAERMGVAESFTEGRDAMQWVRLLYDRTRKSAATQGIELPEFDAFWSGEQIDVAEQLAPREFRLERFRRDPDANPLGTPSGRIELYSETVAGFAYPDCGGHPAWYPHTEWLGGEQAQRFPLHLISNQPRTRLHSQYDHGVTSRSAKIRDREPLRLHPVDAAARGIADGDLVRVFNERGACLAGAIVTDRVRPGVVELPTGAWYDPVDPGDPDSLDAHGNPNVLTRDIGTSKLAQGPSAQSCLVEVERHHGSLPPVRAFEQPPTIGLPPVFRTVPIATRLQPSPRTEPG